MKTSLLSHVSSGCCASFQLVVDVSVFYLMHILEVEFGKTGKRSVRNDSEIRHLHDLFYQNGFNSAIPQPRGLKARSCSMVPNKQTEQPFQKLMNFLKQCFVKEHRARSTAVVSPPCSPEEFCSKRCDATGHTDPCWMTVMPPAWSTLAATFWDRRTYREQTWVLKVKNSFKPRHFRTLRSSFSSTFYDVCSAATTKTISSAWGSSSKRSVKAAEDIQSALEHYLPSSVLTFCSWS